MFDKVKQFFTKKSTQYADVICINEEGNFLILLRSNSDTFEPGKFSLPGGHIEKNEESIFAAARELSEETNINLDVVDLSHFKTLKKKDCVIHYFIASVDTNDIKIILDSDEHQGYEWIKPSEIHNKDFLLDLKDFLLNAFDISSNQLANNINRELISIHDKLNKAENTLNLALDSGLDEDIYLEKISKLNIIKSNLSKSFVTRQNTNGSDYVVRINKNILKSEQHQEVNFAEDFSNYLNKSYLYKGKIYDENGIGLPLTNKQIQDALNSYPNIFQVQDDQINESKYLKTFEGTKRFDFELILPIIKQYNDLYERYLKEIENNFNTARSDFKSRRLEVKQSINDYFSNESTNEDIINFIEYIKNNFNENLDPLLKLKYLIKDKKSNNVYLSELEDYLKQNPESDLNIKTIEIVDLSNYGDMEFKMEYFNPDNSLVISTISNKIREKLKKQVENINILKDSLDDDLVSDDDFLGTFIDIEKAEDPSKGGKLVQKKITDKTGKQTTRWVNKDKDLQNVDEQKDINNDELIEFAKNSSLQDLERTIKESGDENLRKVAHEEIKRRESEESIQNLPDQKTIHTEYKPEERTQGTKQTNKRLDSFENIDGDKEITVYRGIEDGAGDGINNGDYVTPSKQLAKDYAGTGKVVSLKVKMKDLLADDSDFDPEDYEHAEFIFAPKDIEIKKSEDIEILDEPKVEILKGCLMFYPNIDLAKWKGKIQSLVREDVVQEWELEPHLTILYGIDDEKLNISELKSFVSGYLKDNPISFTVNKIGIFSNDKDVIKLNVNDSNRNLTNLNKLIKENFEYQNDFPDYSAHITICYADKGVGTYFDGLEIDPVEFGFDNIEEITLGEVIYSNSNKEYETIYKTTNVIDYNIEKGRKSSPIGTISADGKRIKVEGGWEYLSKQQIANDSLKSNVDNSQFSEFTLLALSDIKNKLNISSNIQLIKSNKNIYSLLDENPNGSLEYKIDKDIYKITLPKKASKFGMIRILAHELTHVKQLESNELIILEDGFKFKDKFISFKQYNDEYRKLGNSENIDFETEAFNNERIIANWFWSTKSEQEVESGREYYE